jgi:hypothetical protein
MEGGKLHGCIAVTDLGHIVTAALQQQTQNVANVPVVVNYKYVGALVHKENLLSKAARNYFLRLL